MDEIDWTKMPWMKRRWTKSGYTVETWASLHRGFLTIHKISINLNHAPEIHSCGLDSNPHSSALLVSNSSRKFLNWAPIITRSKLILFYNFEHFCFQNIRTMLNTTMHGCFGKYVLKSSEISFAVSNNNKANIFFKAECL